jgi:L-iditol 2-dehydrogenase
MMQALVKTQKGPGFIEIRSVPEPSPGAGEVLIEVKACGICGTDIHVWHDQFPYWPPVVMGHEFSGQIVALGPETALFQVGERVVGEPHTRACGHCYLCRTGNIQICPLKRSPGWGIDGAFTKYLKMPERLLHRIPDSMSYELAALVEPTANTVHDLVERARVAAGDLVVVLGPGPIGLLAALTARAAGARHVVIVGAPADEAFRLPKARELGFESVLNGAQVNPWDVVRDLSGGLGADLVVDCSGSAAAIASTVELIRKRGRICAIGLTGKDAIPFPWDKAAFKVCEVIFNLSTSYTSWDRTIHLMASGQLPAGAVITNCLPLSAWQSAFEGIEAQRELKVLLAPE